MIDVQLHFQGVGTEQRKLAEEFAIGSYIGGVDGRLWRVADVVIDGEAAVNVYCVEVSDCLAGELTAAWATWEKLSEEEATACEPYTAADGEPDRTRPNRRGSMQGPGAIVGHVDAVWSIESTRAVAGEIALSGGSRGGGGRVGGDVGQGRLHRRSGELHVPQLCQRADQARGGGLTFPLDNR